MARINASRHATKLCKNKPFQNDTNSNTTILMARSKGDQYFARNLSRPIQVKDIIKYDSCHKRIIKNKEYISKDRTPKLKPKN